MLRRCTQVQGLLFRHFAPFRAMASAPKNSMEVLKQLRERSGAPIVDVKKCLMANDWDAGPYPSYVWFVPDSVWLNVQEGTVQSGGAEVEDPAAGCSSRACFSGLAETWTGSDGKEGRPLPRRRSRSSYSLTVGLRTAGGWMFASLRARQQRG
jgi:hypothetical protein